MKFNDLAAFLFSASFSLYFIYNAFFPGNLDRFWLGNFGFATALMEFSILTCLFGLGGYFFKKGIFRNITDPSVTIIWASTMLVFFYLSGDITLPLIFIYSLGLKIFQYWSSKDGVGESDYLKSTFSLFAIALVLKELIMSFSFDFGVFTLVKTTPGWYGYSDGIFYGIWGFIYYFSQGIFSLKPIRWNALKGI